MDGHDLDTLSSYITERYGEQAPVAKIKATVTWDLSTQIHQTDLPYADLLGLQISMMSSQSLPTQATAPY